MKKTSEVWKFEPLVSESFGLLMPKGAEVLTVQVQHGKPQIWARVDPDAPKETRWFGFFGTGHPIPGEAAGVQFTYVDTFQVEAGQLVFHLFEALRNPTSERTETREPQS